MAHDLFVRCRLSRPPAPKRTRLRWFVCQGPGDQGSKQPYTHGPGVRALPAPLAHIPHGPQSNALATACKLCPRLFLINHSLSSTSCALGNTHTRLCSITTHQFCLWYRAHTLRHVRVPSSLANYPHQSIHQPISFFSQRCQVHRNQHCSTSKTLDQPAPYLKRRPWRKCRKHRGYHTGAATPRPGGSAAPQPCMQCDTGPGPCRYIRTCPFHFPPSRKLPNKLALLRILLRVLSAGSTGQRRAATLPSASSVPPSTTRVTVVLH